MRESQRTLAAFAIYAQLGSTRSIPRLHARLRTLQGQLEFQTVPGIRTLHRWSSELHWQERIAAIEAASAQRVQEELVAQQADAQVRRVKVGLSLQQQGLQVLRARDESEWTVSDALKAIEKGSAIEAQALASGVGATRDEQIERVYRRLEEFSDAELDRLASIADRNAGEAG